MRGYAGLLLLAALTGCASGPLPTLAPGEIALPTFQAEMNGRPVGCGGIGYNPGDAVIHGSPDDPALAWIVFGWDGHRENLLWPPGYRARFTPWLEVLDPNGRVVAREGEFATGGCGMPPDGTWIELPTVTASPAPS